MFRTLFIDDYNMQMLKSHCKLNQTANFQVPKTCIQTPISIAMHLRILLFPNTSPAFYCPTKLLVKYHQKFLYWAVYNPKQNTNYIFTLVAISVLTLTSWCVLLSQKKERERALRFMLWILHGEEVTFQKHYAMKNYTQAITKDLKTFEARLGGIPSFLKSNLQIPLFTTFLALTHQ